MVVSNESEFWKSPGRELRAFHEHTHCGKLEGVVSAEQGKIRECKIRMEVVEDRETTELSAM